MNLTFQAAHRRARGNPLATAASADGDRAAPSGTASDRSEPDLLHRYIARLPASRRTPPVKRAVRRGAQRGPAAWDSLSSPLAAAPKGEGELTTRPAEQKLLDAFLVDSGFATRMHISRGRCTPTPPLACTGGFRARR